MDIVAEQFKTYWVLSEDKLYAGRNYVIDWTAYSLQGRGNKHLRYYLMRSIKGLVTAYILRQEQKYGSISPGTLRGWNVQLRVLVKWMVKNDIWKFSQLSDSDLIDFFEFKKISITNKNKSISNTGMSVYLRLLEVMWEMRSEYLSPLQVNPSLIPELSNLIKSSPSIKQWKPLPNKDALLLIKEAINLLNEIGNKTISCVNYLKKNPINHIGINKNKKKQLVTLRYKALEQEEEYKSLLYSLNTTQIGANTNLRLAMRGCHGAAAAIILFLTGIRVSELLSLESDCIQYITHTNQKSYSYIRAIAAKKKGATKLWIAPEPVVYAINFLANLASMTNPPNLKFIFTSSGFGAIPHPWTKVGKVQSEHTVAKLVRDFAIKTKNLDSQAYSNFHPHQARKNFARFVALRDKRALGALAQHYGHAYYGITDHSYVGTDIKLHELLNQESRNNLADGLLDLITSKNIAGKAGNFIESFRKSSKKFVGKKAIKQLIDKLINEGVVLAPCDWGYCLYSKDLSACKGGMDGPNPIYRTPSVCSGCSNFAVTETHRIWWEERHQREIEFLKNENLSLQAIELCKARATESLNILKQLNVALVTSRGRQNED